MPRAASTTERSHRRLAPTREQPRPWARDAHGAHGLGLAIEDRRCHARLTDHGLLALECVTALADRRELPLQRSARVEGVARSAFSDRL